MDKVKRWIQDQFTPVVLVAATPAAEAICTSKNGLSIVDILRPFSHVTRLDASVRVGDEVVKLQDLKLRLHGINTLQQPRPEALEHHLHGVLSAAAAKYIQGDAEPPDLAAAVTSVEGIGQRLSDLAPWFYEYADEFLRVTGWNEHSMIDHPVAAILVAPADVMDPVQHFEALLSQTPPPPLMQREVMYPLRDREFPRHYVLLQDCSAPLVDDRRAAENLMALRRTFGETSASLLKINSGAGGVSGGAGQAPPPELFKRHMALCVPGGGAGEPESRPVAPPEGLGAWLSAKDLDNVASCLRDMVVHLLLPRLEERMAKLNQGVTATRKGLRNRIQRLWKGSNEDAMTDKPFPWHSVESQIRQLADLAFLLGAYSFANDMYRLASQDYQAAGNMKWYAGAEEMRGLAVIMAPNDNDPQKYFARAQEGYARLGTPAGTRLATRTVLLCARFQLAVGRYLAASLMLLKPHQDEESGRAAVMLEQSGYCLLFTSPPSLRKFAFYLVLAGLRYKAAGLNKMSLHVYRQALRVYVGHQWNATEAHLHDLLGRLHQEAGDESRAANHFLSLLQLSAGSGKSVANQAHCMELFTQSVRKLALKGAAPGGLLSFPDLGLPFINTTDFKVLFADTSCAGNAAASSMPDTSWSTLEVACSGDANVMRDAASTALKQQTKDHEEYNQTAAGEAIGIAISLKNRLAVKLRISQLRLMVEFTPLDDKQAPLPLTDSVGLQNKQSAVGQGLTRAETAGSSVTSEDGLDHIGPLSPPSSQTAVNSSSLHPLASGQAANWMKEKSPYIHQQAVRLSLHPGESATETLTVTPLAAGWMRITGVAWVLNDEVEGTAQFTPKGRKRKHPKGPKPSQQKHFPPSRRLVFQVAPAMCRLHLVQDTMPTSMYTGEVCKVVMEVVNTGSLPCKGLLLGVNNHEVCCSGATLSNVGQGDHHMHSDSAADLLGLHSDTSLQDGVIDASKPTGPRIHSLRLPSSLQGSGVSVYQPLPSDAELLPGGTTRWTLWLHTRGTGSFTLQLVWYCEVVAAAGLYFQNPHDERAATLLQGGGQSAIKYRTLRAAHSIQVTPILAPNLKISPLSADLAAHLVRLDLDVTQGEQAVLLHQIAAMTHGRNVGWRMIADVTAEATPAAAGAPASNSTTLPQANNAKVSVMPNLRLVVGSPTSISLIMKPPEASASEIPLQSADPVQLDCTSVCPVSVLQHWYVQHSKTIRSMGMLRARMGSSASLANASTQSLSSMAASTSQLSNLRPTAGQASMQHSDPPVDLALLWRTVPAPGSAALPRMGIVTVFDVTSTYRPPSQPLRTRIRLTNSASAATGIIQHDFRSSAMCLVDLTLTVRNCTGSDVQLEVEAGEDGKSNTSHSWMINRPASPGPPGTPSQHASHHHHQPGTPAAGSQLHAAAAGQGQPQTVSYPAGLQPGSDYTWCGRSRARCACLEPGMVWEIPLRVAVFKPGAYVVSGCRVYYQPVSLNDGRNSASMQNKRNNVHVEPLTLRIDMS